MNPTKGNLWLVLFTVSSTVSVLVNKYVLWQLKFTFPTIFQSWQMCFASFLLYSCHLIGCLSYSKALTGAVVKRWLPAIVLFSLSIYSGSISLARLPIPIFCFMQQGVLQSMSFIIRLKYHSFNSMLIRDTAYASVIILCLLATVGFIGNLTFNFGWMIVHCAVGCGYSYFALKTRHLGLQEFDKLLINSVFSIVLLLLIGVSTGESTFVFEFPYLYNNVFILACTCSGVFGAATMISYSRLCRDSTIEKVRFFYTIIMAGVSLASFVCFDNNEITTKQMFVIYLGLISTCLLSHLNQEISSSTTASAELDNPTKRPHKNVEII